MNKLVPQEIREVMGAVHYRPAISIIMPFEPKMSLKTEIAYALKTASDRVERELREHYPNELGVLVMQKLRLLIKNLNFNTHKKSIAIFVSPVFEKVLYLDIAVEEKIIVDESFEIRDLVFAKKQVLKYLVLLLSGKEVRIFLGNSNNFVRILSDQSESVYAVLNDPPERVANFSDISDRKEIVTEKFLRHIDHSLDSILGAYPLPLFVCGVTKITGHFKKISKHAASVLEYIHGNFEDATIPRLKEALDPYISNWKKVRQKELLNLLHDAADKKKLAAGMTNVWREASKNTGRLLVIEKDFMYPAKQGPEQGEIGSITEPHHHFSYIRDAVDDVIEKVLEHGGDVEFTEKGMLKDFGQIALILFY
jgi:hypothetical protein